MLISLHLQNVGPADEMSLDFGSRLNILTGDNGLGKSFLLDIAWWALTRKWPQEIKPSLTSGLMARPTNPKKEARIAFELDSKSKSIKHTSTFQTKEQAWIAKRGRPHNPGLVLYAMPDGGFAVWDPARNYWKTKGDYESPDRPSAYLFTPMEIWNGLRDNSRGVLCNGLIADWGNWYREKTETQTFEQLQKVLERLSPPHEKITAGPLKRVSIDDVRDIPTIRMPYGDVPVLHASAGIRRILSLSYLLVWAWNEHLQAAELLGEQPTDQIIFLIDEVESHLHPKWQRVIIPALMEVVSSLTEKSSGIRVQIISATHSPLVLASLEPSFDDTRDAWFDLDMRESEQGCSVSLEKRPFEKCGDITGWLMSEAFDLKTGYSLEAEQLFTEIGAFLRQETQATEEARRLHKRLLELVGPRDPFLFRWRAVCEQKGWLEEPTSSTAAVRKTPGRTQ
uniref:AAA family ATPase n=1 Tax=uncultured Bilophila sp. TaxID=529385 RepID=UPI0025D696F3|nr:ATP-binding protein [uncultured Bilophila sp.]